MDVNVVHPSLSRPKKTQKAVFMWLYNSGRGYTQKCVVIRLVCLLLRRQPTTNTSQWLYVVARGYTWLYIVHVPHSLPPGARNRCYCRPPFIVAPVKTQKTILCGYTTQVVVIHKSAWLYNSSISFCVGSLSRIPVGGYTSSLILLFFVMSCLIC